jgi:polar amino acid transport system substrate-binding protein
MRGAAEEIVGTALSRIGLAHEVRFAGPFKRMLAAAEAGEIDIVVESKRLPEREIFLAYSPQPIFINSIAIFYHKGRTLRLHRREDLIGLRGGIVLGNRFGGDFDEFLQTRLSYETVPHFESAFNMLAEDRLDYFVTSYYPGMFYLKRHHLQEKFLTAPFFAVQTENFVAMSKKSTCLGNFDRLNATLAAMIRDGDVKKILSKALKMQRIAHR